MPQIALGDFNHDGYLDIVVTSQDNNAVLVLLNNGDGTFQGPSRRSHVGAATITLVVGDFNHDGNLDIAATIYSVSQDSGYVWILLNQGDGIFQEPPRRYRAVPHGEVVGPVAVGDFNHDGYLDIVTADSGLEVTVLLGNGDGTFQPYKSNTIATLGPSSVAVGDFNHDGYPDIVTANPYADDNTISVLRGNGDGTFQKHVDYKLEEAAIIVAVGDFNNDGYLDIVTANSTGISGTGDGTISILLNKGDGTFSLPQTYYPVGAAPVALAVGDVDNDGNLDIVTVDLITDTQSALITVFYGNGDGTFGPAPAILKFNNQRR